VDPQPTELAGSFGGHYAPSEKHGIVHAPHWYDAIAMGIQRYVSWLGADTHGGRARLALGREGRRRSFRKQVERFTQASDEMFGGVPTLIGETGIALNMHGKEAYRSGDFSRQVAALDDTMQALETSLVSFTLWNYTADNSNERGDQWNDEDFSIFSRDQMSGSGSIHDGGRALLAVVRPYARKVPGEPLRMSFDPGSGRFEFEFRLDPSVEGPAEFFVPDLHYSEGYDVATAHGEWQGSPEGQTVLFWPRREQLLHRVAISPR
jgi:hypothetical protein